MRHNTLHIFRVFALICALPLHSLAQTSQPAPDNSLTAPAQPRINPDWSLLPNIIHQSHLAAITEIDPAQQAELNRCFLRYLDRADQLAAEAARKVADAKQQLDAVQKRLDQLNEELPRLSEEDRQAFFKNFDVPQFVHEYESIADANRQAEHEARSLIAPRYIQAENDFINQAKPILTDNQQQELLAIIRATWFELSTVYSVRLVDPIEILRKLQPFMQNTPQQDDFNALLQTDDLSDIQRLFNLHDLSKMAYFRTRYSQTDGDIQRSKAGNAYGKAWESLYRKLNSTLDTGISLLRAADHSDYARLAQEKFWADCFPVLLNNEFTPELLGRLERTPKDHSPSILQSLPAETQSAVAAAVEEFLADRHELLRQAVNQYVSDFLETINDPDNAVYSTRFSYPSYGTSSKKVAELQLKRCQLALRFRDRLAQPDMLGKQLLDSLLTAVSAHSKDIAGRPALDLPETEPMLIQLIADFDAPPVTQ
ncbi:MAG TPA: hypothetical protein VG711_05040 [Phycisphaerales bacterium]|nr:hypothetical protein [Phycisphaerales bacterium]